MVDRLQADKHPVRLEPESLHQKGARRARVTGAPKKPLGKPPGAKTRNGQYVRCPHGKCDWKGWLTGYPMHQARGHKGKPRKPIPVALAERVPEMYPTQSHSAEVGRVIEPRRYGASTTTEEDESNMATKAKPKTPPGNDEGDAGATPAKGATQPKGPAADAKKPPAKDQGDDGCPLMGILGS
jgi:hypothetical protein